MPKGFPDHPGTSFLADAAPVVKMAKGYAQARTTVNGGGCSLQDLLYELRWASMRLSTFQVMSWHPVYQCTLFPLSDLKSS